MTAARELAIQRLNNQHILNPALKEPGAVVEALGALQAQDFAGALWSIGLRMPGGTMPTVSQAINDRQIIRTWLLRGTLHFVAPQDVRWILKLVAPRIIAGSAGRHRQLGLTGEDFSQSRELFSEELQGGRQLSRDELFQSLKKAGISPEGQRGYHLLAMAGLEGLICFGSLRGRQQTFVLLDEWVPESGRAFGPREALAHLAERYFTAHGPATLQDYSWWSGLKASEAKAGIETAGPLLSRVSYGGMEYFTGDAQPYDSGDVLDSYLLPGFDEYILGYRDRSAMLDPTLAERTVIGANGMMLPTIVVDGSVMGTWKRTLGKRAIAVKMNPFSPLNSPRRLLIAAAAERYGWFMGNLVTIEWSPASIKNVGIVAKTEEKMEIPDRSDRGAGKKITGP